MSVDLDELGAQSFPASDAPSYSVTHAGPPTRLAARGGDASRWIGLAQGGVWIASGLWPIVNIRTFERATGRKPERWLVKIIGALVAVIGVELARRSLRGRPARFLGATAAATIAAVDLVYVAERKLPSRYLADAAVEGAFLVAWLSVAERA